VVVLVVVAAVVVPGIVAAIVILRMPGRSFHGTPPSLTPVQLALRDALRRDVHTLAGDIGELNVTVRDGYARAAAFIEQSFRDSGYATSRQTYVVDGVDCSNIVAEVKGTSDEVVVVGAHYDTVDDSPGADDNGSGVAALLALARHFAKATPKRTIRFIAFANEEPPYFTTDRMGSFIAARTATGRGDRIVAMLSLETIGYFNEAPHSQAYPAMLERVFPSTGNFIAFVSNTSSGALLRHCVDVFRKHATIPSEGAALPEAIPGIAWSDQWSYWRHGVPAVMVTDTALFRNPNYHTPHDTPETLDYDRLARVVDGLGFVIEDLSGYFPATR